MGARYWVLVSDELLESQPQWPAGFRLVERGGVQFPGARWWLAEDNGAPEDLNGKEVEPVLQRDGQGAVTIAERKVVGRLPVPPPEIGTPVPWRTRGRA